MAKNELGITGSECDWCARSGTPKTYLKRRDKIEMICVFCQNAFEHGRSWSSGVEDAR